MPEAAFSDDEIVDRLLPIVMADVPHLPHPGPQVASAEVSGQATDPTIQGLAGLALRRLLDLGASTEDLYAVARWIAAEVLMDALTRLFDEDGELAGQLYYAIDGHKL